MKVRSVPVIALDYKEKHKAVPKELLIDYDTGNIYIVSKTDKSKIFDITSKIKDQIKNLNGGQIEINIEGIGTVSLTDIIAKLNGQIKNSVQLIETNEDVNYVGQESVPDHNSVEFDKRNLQIKGFNEAPDLSIPRKKDGRLEWVDPESFFNLSFTSGLADNDNGNVVIGPSNPNDGRILYCYNLEPLNSKIFLRASKRQKSRFIPVDCRIILPRTVDEYSCIEWYVVTGEYAPKFTFSNNIVWRNETIQPVSKGHQIYKFESWDYGKTWLGELIIYDGNKSAFGFDTTYFDDKFCTKKDIDKNYYNKNQMDEKYINIDVLNNGYFTKREINNSFYNKDDIQDILSWKRNPSNNKDDKSGDK